MSLLIDDLYLSKVLVRIRDGMVERAKSFRSSSPDSPSCLETHTHDLLSSGHIRCTVSALFLAVCAMVKFLPSKEMHRTVVMLETLQFFVPWDMGTTLVASSVDNAIAWNVAVNRVVLTLIRRCNVHLFGRFLNYIADFKRSYKVVKFTDKELAENGHEMSSIVFFITMCETSYIFPFVRDAVAKTYNNFPANHKFTCYVLAMYTRMSMVMLGNTHTMRRYILKIRNKISKRCELRVAMLARILALKNLRNAFKYGFVKNRSSKMAKRLLKMESPPKRKVVAKRSVETQTESPEPVVHTNWFLDEMRARWIAATSTDEDAVCRRRAELEEFRILIGAVATVSVF